MKIVLDTNVLIAALIARGVCSELLGHCVLNHELIVSQFILDELRGNLAGKFKYTDEEADEAVTLMRSQMQIVAPISLKEPVCRDADDDQVLATAVAGSAECVITGDKDLLVLKTFDGIAILRPGDFADFESKHDRQR